MLPRGCSANKITPARWLAAAAATAGDARRMPLLLEPAARPVQVSEFTKTVKKLGPGNVRRKIATGCQLKL